MRNTKKPYKRDILNQIINFFWTALCFSPLVLVSGRNRQYLLLCISWRSVQNGDIVNSHSKTLGATAIKDKSQARKYLKTIAMYERYHWICLIFFLVTSIYGFFNGHLLFGFSISIANLLYNLIPIFLQQYNKIRIKKIVD